MPFLTVCAVPEPPWPNLRPQFSGLVVFELRAVNTEGTGGQLPFQILADQLGSPIPTGRDDYTHHFTTCSHPADFQTFLRPCQNRQIRDEHLLAITGFVQSRFGEDTIQDFLIA